MALRHTDAFQPDRASASPAEPKLWPETMIFTSAAQVLHGASRLTIAPGRLAMTGIDDADTAPYALAWR